MDIFIVLYILYLLLPVSDQLNIKECGDKCCAHYYKESGKCIECQLGHYRFKEDTDRYCKPCEVGFYGKRCSKICNCLNDERCDKTYGCVCDHTNSKVGKCNDSNFSRKQPTRHNSTTEYGNTVTDKNIIRQLLIFGLPCVVSVVLIIVIVCVITQKVSCTINMRVHHQSNTSHTLNLNDGYDIIDENLIVDNNIASNISPPLLPTKSVKSGTNTLPSENTNYLYPISDSLSNDGAKSIRNNSDADEYLHPYNSLETDWQSNTHVYNDEEPEILNDGYLNPYQPLKENWLQTTHVYNMTETHTDLDGKTEDHMNPEKSLQETEESVI